MQRLKQRPRQQTIAVEEDLEQKFTGLKTKIDLVQSLVDIFGNDSDGVMQKQLQIAKSDVRKDIKSLLVTGVSIMDLFERFGSILFKSEILNAKDVLNRLTEGKDKQLVDLYNEDQLLIDRLKRQNNPEYQQLEQRARTGQLAPILAIDRDPLRDRIIQNAIRQFFGNQQNNNGNPPPPAPPAPPLPPAPQNRQNRQRNQVQIQQLFFPPPPPQPPQPPNPPPPQPPQNLIQQMNPRQQLQQVSIPLQQINSNPIQQVVQPQQMNQQSLQQIQQQNRLATQQPQNSSNQQVQTQQIRTLNYKQQTRPSTNNQQVSPIPRQQQNTQIQTSQPQLADQNVGTSKQIVQDQKLSPFPQRNKSPQDSGEIIQSSAPLQSLSTNIETQVQSQPLASEIPDQLYDFSQQQQVNLDQQQLQQFTPQAQSAIVHLGQWVSANSGNIDQTLIDAFNTYANEETDIERLDEIVQKITQSTFFNNQAIPQEILDSIRDNYVFPAQQLISSLMNNGQQLVELIGLVNQIYQIILQQTQQQPAIAQQPQLQQQNIAIPPQQIQVAPVNQSDIQMPSQQQEEQKQPYNLPQNQNVDEMQRQRAQQIIQSINTTDFNQQLIDNFKDLFQIEDSINEPSILTDLLNIIHSIFQNGESQFQTIDGNEIDLFSIMNKKRLYDEQYQQIMQKYHNSAPNEKSLATQLIKLLQRYYSSVQNLAKQVRVMERKEPYRKRSMQELQQIGSSTDQQQSVRTQTTSSQNMSRQSLIQPTRLNIPIQGMSPQTQIVQQSFQAPPQFYRQQIEEEKERPALNQRFHSPGVNDLSQVDLLLNRGQFLEASQLLQQMLINDRNIQNQIIISSRINQLVNKTKDSDIMNQFNLVKQQDIRTRSTGLKQLLQLIINKLDQFGQPEEVQPIQLVQQNRQVQQNPQGDEENVFAKEDDKEEEKEDKKQAREQRLQQILAASANTEKSILEIAGMFQQFKDKSQVGLDPSTKKNRDAVATLLLRLPDQARQISIQQWEALQNELTKQKDGKVSRSQGNAQKISQFLYSLIGQIRGLARRQ